MIKKFWLLCILTFSIFFSLCKADEIQWYTIIPELTENEIKNVSSATEDIGKEAWLVRKNYNEKAENLSIQEQFNWWILTWNSIMQYLVFVVKFLSQFWVLIWACFIIYAWYNYMMSCFNNWSTSSKTIQNAIIWVLIVIFSYAIMKILSAIFTWT